MVDVPLDALSLTDLAVRKGVSKQVVDKLAKAFIADGLLSALAVRLRSNCGSSQ